MKGDMIFYVLEGDKSQSSTLTKNGQVVLISTTVLMFCANGCGEWEELS